jgi:putative membrane protein
MMMYGFGAWGWGGMVIGMILNIAVLVGLVVLAVWAVQRVSRNSDSHQIPASGTQTAREIAQGRYARGEINREEYQQILSDLNQ